jgi:hypothetical protein
MENLAADVIKLTWYKLMNEEIAEDVLKMILLAQVQLDNNNACSAEAILASAVKELNNITGFACFKDKQLQEVFEYYTELNNIQGQWERKDER